MSVIHLTHGTSFSRAKDILKNGFGNFKDVVWNCSDDEITYFYELDKFMKAECIDKEDYEYGLKEMIRRSNENAQITAALEEEPGNKTIVFEFIIDANKVNISVIETDYSAPNMNYYGAVTVPDSVLNYWIENKLVEIRVHKFPFCAKISLLYLNGVKDSEYLQSSLERLSSIERYMLNAMNEVYYEEIFEIEEDEDVDDFYTLSYL